MSLTPGTRLGPYEVVASIGRGGMGEVFRANDTKLQRQVALKVPQLDGENPAVVQRFYREAKVAARLEHPNLCPVLDVGDVDGVHYLTMPFLDGAPLSQLIDESRPWPVKQAAELVCRLARALAVMHEAGGDPPRPEAGQHHDSQGRAAGADGLRAGAIR